MASLNRNLPAFFNTDQDFRDFAQFFHDILNSGGWVNTTDTGQINLGTVTKPSAASTAQGYEIWKMSDSQQSALPCYMKIEYGSAASTADRPAVWITVGTGSNGSGTLNGQVGTRTTIGAQAAKTAGITLPAYASAAPDRFSFVVNYDNTSASFHFLACVERSSDSNGSSTADCIFTYYHHSGSNPTQVIPPSPTGIPSQGSTGPFHAAPGAVNGGLSSIGNNVAVVPGIYVCGKPFFTRSFLTYKDADITGGSTITGLGPGGSHNYIAFTKTSGVNPIDVASSSNSVLMLFE